MTELAVPGFDPDHYYYDHLGNPITIDEWARLRSLDRTLRQDIMNTMDGPVDLVTMYLGFVCPDIYDARLFGSAIISAKRINQIEVYDSEQGALLGHLDHVEANQAGFHCRLCRDGKKHQD